LSNTSSNHIKQHYTNVPITINKKINLDYINDMLDLCNQQHACCTGTYLYADDAKIYRVINRISDQADIQAVVNTVKKLVR